MLPASLWLLSVMCQTPVDLRVNVPLVLIPVHVTNTLGTSVTNLTRADFRLLEDNVEQNITHFSNEEAALSIGLLFDSSGSMRNKMKKSMAAITTFFKTANAQDEFFLIEFNERPRLLAPFTRDLDDIRTRLGRVKPFGRTALLDAIRMALEEMKSARNSRKVILILSDGGDNRSRYTEFEIKGQASESDSQIYSMGIFESGDSLKRTPEERNGPRLLNDLAEQTGGRHFPVNHLDDLPDICARISTEFRSQYLLGYSPANGAVDGKYRQVKVQVVSPPNAATLKVHHRPGYYAPDGAGW
jgi:Ca-activated chloride channel family protein